MDTLSPVGNGRDRSLHYAPCLFFHSLLIAFHSSLVTPDDCRIDRHGLSPIDDKRVDVDLADIRAGAGKVAQVDENVRHDFQI